MESKNECPFCGCIDIVPVTIKDGIYEGLRVKDSPAGMCRCCKTIGPFAKDNKAAIKALCRPEHLTTNKVIISLATARGLKLLATAAAADCSLFDGPVTCIENLSAAIDAASKE